MDMILFRNLRFMMSVGSIIHFKKQSGSERFMDDH